MTVGGISVLVGRKGRAAACLMAALLAVAVVGGLAPAEAAAAEPVGSAAKFVPLSPARVMDTRLGIGAPAGRPAPSAVVDLTIVGVGGVPATGATAVVLNLTITGSVNAGYLQALPTGLGQLGASSSLNLNYPGQTVAALVTVPIGIGGRVSFYDVPGGHLIADVFGYYTETPVSSDGRYQPVTPTRILDSRNRTGMAPIVVPPGPQPPANPGDTKNCTNFANWDQANAWFWTYYPYYGDVAKLDGNNDLIPCESLPGARSVPYQPPGPPVPPAPDLYPKPTAGSVIDLQITGRAGVPTSGVSSVVLNVTATDSDGGGFAQVIPSGGGAAVGSSSNLNINSPAETVANLVMVPVGADGRVQLFLSVGVDVIADVAAYFTDSSAPADSAGLFVALQPTRLMDTRAGGKPAGGSITQLAPSGLGGVPTDGVSAVVLNATVTQPDAGGFLQLYPTGWSTPGASSNLNYPSAQTVANAAIIGLGDAKRISIYTPISTHFLADVFGYFTATTQGANPALDGLIIAPKNTSAAYDRNTWQHWIDADNDCQDTRTEVLIAEATGPITLSPNGCTVTAGTWIDPYTGTTWTQPSDLDVDHVVPLKNAHDSGGWTWGTDQKRLYANDLTYELHLIAVEDNLNQSKGDKGPEAWQPPLASYRCAYATEWVTIKRTWQLTVTQAEYDALAQMISTC